jgi:hypothetical protein
MDIFGDHALTCKSLGVYGRHNVVRNAFASLCSETGLRVQLEVQAPESSARPADVLVYGLESSPTAIDIAVIHELRPSIPFAGVFTADLIAAEEIRKNSSFRNLHRNSHWNFHPFVCNTYGALGKCGNRIIQKVIKHRTLKFATAFVDEATHIYTLHICICIYTFCLSLRDIPTIGACFSTQTARGGHL